MVELGPAEISLDDEHLALIGKATALEAQAKTFLSLSLKRIIDADHDRWLELDRIQFKQIVDMISEAVSSKDNLKSAFSRVANNHERWRESRNIVVHTIWGTGTDGHPEAHCYRRKLSADRNDIVRAANDCWWLAKECRKFAHHVGEAVLLGALPKCKEGEGQVHLQLSNGSVTF